LILLAIDQGPVHPCFSEDILEEYAAVLARAKFASAGRDRGGARHVPQSG
jgi:predicted nucleic acid-binding protein